MTESTQARIIEYLHKNQSAAAAELAQALIVTKGDVQYHLKLLEQNGAIQRLPQDARRRKGRGRPSVFFQLSPQSKPDSLAPLAGALLDALLLPLKGAHEHPSVALSSVAAALFGHPEPLPSLTQTLNQVVTLLNRYPYQARWEARRAGPCILLKNCPYAKLLPDHPELCQLDQQALQQMLHRPVHLDARIDFQRPSSACVFRVSAIPSG